MSGNSFLKFPKLQFVLRTASNEHVFVQLLDKQFEQIDLYIFIIVIIFSLEFSVFNGSLDVDEGFLESRTHTGVDYQTVIGSTLEMCTVDVTDVLTISNVHDLDITVKGHKEEEVILVITGEELSGGIACSAFFEKF
jgi:hypothetical protein